MAKTTLGSAFATIRNRVAWCETAETDFPFRETFTASFQTTKAFTILRCVFISFAVNALSKSSLLPGSDLQSSDIWTLVALA